MYIKTSDQERLTLGIGEYSCNWGMHIAGLYETKEEKDKIIFGFLKQGYYDGDLLLYCSTERSEDDFKHKFSNHCPECILSLKEKDPIFFLSDKDLYYPDGTFNPLAMEKELEDFFAKSQKNKKRNIRAIAEMVWTRKAIPGIEHLMAYESLLNYFIPDKPWISICLYNINEFSGNEIMDVLRTHPYTIIKGILTQNPYFVEPTLWLSENAPQFLFVK